MFAEIPDLPLRLAILGATYCMSAFFSGSETALFTFQCQVCIHLDKKGRPGASGGDL